MSRTFDEVVVLYHERKTAAGPLHAKAQELTDTYNGDLAVPLPELDASERTAVPNLLAQGLNQMGMRIASTLPDVYYPPERPGQRQSEQYARIRRLATLGWWEHSELDVKLGRRARHLIGYATSPVVIRPDFKRGVPVWQTRSPLRTFAAPTDEPDGMTPDDCIFTYQRTLAWLQRNYPAETRVLSKGPAALPDTRFELLEYVDEDQWLLGVLGAPRDPRDTTGAAGTAEQMQLGPAVPNRAGVCPAVVPGRISLDRRQGAYDGMIGIYQRQARIMALEAIAVERDIFPDEWLIGRPGEVPAVIQIADGRRGTLGIAKGGVLQSLHNMPGVKTLPMLSYLERAQRLEGGVPAEFGGECLHAEAEIFTASGWRRYDDVAVGDEVLTLNHESGLSEWKPLLAVNVFADFDAEVMEADGPRHHSVSTLNHRWPVVNRGRRQWRSTRDLGVNDRIPIAAPHAELPTEPKYADDLVELVAWFYTEGHDRGSGGEIAQREGPNAARIRHALRQTFGEPSTEWRKMSGAGQGGVGHDGVPRWRESAGSNGVLQFLLSSHAVAVLRDHAPGRVPRFAFLRCLTAGQLELFIQVSLWADNCGEDRFGQKDPRRTEAFAFACVLAGRGVSYQKREKVDLRPGWPTRSTAYIVRARRRMFVKPVENATRGSSTWQRRRHRGLVWCPTTENGTWLVRDRGSVFFTGNSATNVRTGRRGDAILSAVVDFPVQEAQRVLGRSMSHENRIAIATAKGYFGSRPQSFYVNAKGAKGRVDYVPNKHFGSDVNLVTYSHAGADINSLVVGLGQRLGTGIMSKRTAQEIDPLIDDPEREHDRSVAEALEAATLSSVQQGAVSGQIAPHDVAAIADAVATDRLSLYAAIEEVHRQAQQRQATAGPPGAPLGPVPPGASAAQPGIGAPGSSALAGSIAPTANEQGLAKLMSALGRPVSVGQSRDVT